MKNDSLPELLKLAVVRLKHANFETQPGRPQDRLINHKKVRVYSLLPLKPTLVTQIISAFSGEE